MSHAPSDRLSVRHQTIRSALAERSIDALVVTALPNITFAPVEAYVADSRAPYEDLVIDRTLPSFAGRADTASTGSTQSAQSPWANDYNFIAPAL